MSCTATLPPPILLIRSSGLQVYALLDDAYGLYTAFCDEYGYLDKRIEAVAAASCGEAEHLLNPRLKAAEKTIEALQRSSTAAKTLH